MAIRWDMLSVRFSERDDKGFINLQPTYYGEATGGPAVEAHFALGTFGRPLDPDPDVDAKNQGTGATALVGELGDELFVVPLQDPRYIPLLPDPGKGGAGLYGCIGGALPAVAYMLFWGAGGQNPIGVTPQGGGGPKPPGSFTLRVPYASGQKACLIEVDLTEPDEPEIRITHGDGPLIRITKDEVQLGDTGGSKVVVDDGSLLAYLAAVGAPHGLTPPPSITASKVKAT